MDGQTVFCKTRRGQAAIQERGRELSLVQRRALILVDGETPLEALLAQAAVPDLEAHIRTLWEVGYIEVLGADVDDTVIEDASCHELKKALVHRAYDLLGREGQSALEKLREAPEDPDALEQALTKARKLVRLTLDEDKAEVLYREGSQLIEDCRAGR